MFVECTSSIDYIFNSFSFYFVWIFLFMYTLFFKVLCFCVSLNLCSMHCLFSHSVFRGIQQRTLFVHNNFLFIPKRNIYYKDFNNNILHQVLLWLWPSFNSVMENIEYFLFKSHIENYIVYAVIETFIIRFYY